MMNYLLKVILLIFPTCIWGQAELYIRVFKQEQLLELWQKRSGERQFSLFKEFEVCAKSGNLGPKRKEGDGQIPEGFYFITALEPENRFYKGLRLNYPNESDLILSDKEKPGSDILIHGSCFSTGCVSLSNEQMDMLFEYTESAFNKSSKKIHVHIFPYKLHSKKIPETSQNAIQLWEILEEVQRHFEEWKTLPWLKMKENGFYKIIK